MQAEALCPQCVLTNAAYPLGDNTGHTGTSVESLDFGTSFVNHEATSCTGAGTNGGTWTRAASGRSSSRR